MPDPVATMTAMHTLADNLPGYQNAHRDLLIHGGEVFRVTVERVPPDEVREAFDEFIEETGHGHEDC